MVKLELFQSKLLNYCIVLNFQKAIQNVEQHTSDLLCVAFSLLALKGHTVYILSHLGGYSN